MKTPSRRRRNGTLLAGFLMAALSPSVTPTQAAAPVPTNIRAPPPLAPPRPAGPDDLPGGRLLYLGSGSRTADFLALDQSKRAGDIVDVWMFVVVDPAIQQYGLIVSQSLQHDRYDCATRRSLAASELLFDEAGSGVNKDLAEPPTEIPAGSIADSAFGVVCKGVTPPTNDIVVGHAAALEFGRKMLRNKTPLIGH